MQDMRKVGSILIFIVFIIQSIIVIPLIWTIPGFILYSKINKGEATNGQIIGFSILGIIFAGILGIIGGILILVDENNKNKEKVVDVNQTNSTQE